MSQSNYGFTVSFDFPVFFTWDTFSPANRAFVDAIRQQEPSRRHRLVFFIDEHVATAHPTLPAEIDAYIGAFPESLQLLASPAVVPGGEVVKNDLTHTLFVLKQLNDLGLDRQSFV